MEWVKRTVKNQRDLRAFASEVLFLAVGLRRRVETFGQASAGTTPTEHLVKTHAEQREINLWNFPTYPTK
jgi:hypothetical protein